MADDILCRNVLHQLSNYVNSRLEWGKEQFKSMCPNIKKPMKKCIKSKKAKEDADIGLPCMKKKLYIPPSQICPKIVSCCYIKMQDPYALPCCEPEKPKLSPCPPKCHFQQLQKPDCSCDFCKKQSISRHKCCHERHFVI